MHIELDEIFFNANETHHYVTHPALPGFQSSGCRAEACGFHCRSSRAFEVDEVERSSENEQKKNC